MTASLLVLLAVGVGYLATHVTFDWIAKRFLIVSAAEYLVLGILLGPRVSNLVTAPVIDSLTPIVILALGWIGAIVGTRFELRRLLTIPSRTFRIAFAESAMTLLVVAGLEFFVLRWTFASTDAAALNTAIVLGAMAVASSGVGVSVASRVLGARGGVVEQLELSTAVNSLVAIVTFGLLLCVLHQPAPASRPLTATEWAVVSCALGVVGGALFHLFIGDTPQPHRLFIALVGGVVLVSGAAAYMRLSPLLAALLFGIALVNSTSNPRHLVEALARVEQPFYYVLLVVGGASWQPSSEAWLPAVALFVVARAASKLGGARLATRANGALGDLGLNWGRGLLGQGRVALAIGLNVLHQDQPFYRNLIFSAAIVSIVVTEFFSARLARSAIEAAGLPTTQAESLLVADELPGVAAPDDALKTPASSADAPLAAPGSD